MMAEIEQKIREMAKDTDVSEQFEMENEEELDIRDFDAGEDGE